MGCPYSPLSLHRGHRPWMERCWLNISIKGIPLQADAGTLADYVHRLFHHVSPGFADQEIVLDRTHRVGPHGHQVNRRISLTVTLFPTERGHYGEVRDRNLVDFERAKSFLPSRFKDRGPSNPLPSSFGEKGIIYIWGHPFHIIFVWNNETHRLRTIEEANSLLGSDFMCSGDMSPSRAAGSPTQPAWDISAPPVTRRKLCKPSAQERCQEQDARLQLLQRKGNASDPDNH
ncbi:hypothetical protein NDU88_006310 [Pleurodeles waltl]|uniref:Uncharacterized protein n=1 Tax=Pleurodeles waltl TaxID=8319 RepID=A0AAV7QHP1_PLEWA|nr:hypothetical protein NDU88_006310 [Pleurodeles waltl]